MAPEDNIQPEAEVKPAARKRAPRKKVVATPADGEAGAPAASAETAVAPARKQRAPRKKTTKPAAEAPASAEKPVEKPAAASVAEEKPAPAAEKPADKAPEAPASAAPQQEQRPRKEKDHHTKHQKNNKPQHQQQKNEQQPKAEAVPAPRSVEKNEDRATDIENPDATPQLPPAPGFAVPETVGGSEGGSNSRRKRRRNRNRNRENGQQPQQPQATPQVDKEELVRRAWKIFLGEVTEEGLALMDDRTAAEASRRAFRVAELFLIEAARHRPTTAPVAEEVIEEPEVEDFATEDTEQE